MKALFPILTLIFTIFLFIRYGIWEKIFGKENYAKEPRKTKPASKSGVLAKEDFIDVAGFFKQAQQDTDAAIAKMANTTTDPVVSASTQPKTSTTQITREFPLWTGPSIKFAETANDAYYLEFRDTYLMPTPEMIARLQSMPIQKAVVPDFGQQLSNSDVDIRVIPWDADNKEYLEKDIVWGYVSSQASKSIFLKVYNENVISDPNNFDTNPNDDNRYSLMYKSALLTISTDDPLEGAFYQAIDSQFASSGSIALTNIRDSVYQKLFSDKTEKNAQKALDMKTNAERALKLQSGQSLSDVEKLAQKNHDKKYNISTLFNKIDKTLDKFSSYTKFKAGINKMKGAISKLANVIKDLTTKFINKFIPKFITKATTVLGVSGGMKGVAIAAAAATFGVASPFAAIIIAVTAVIDAVCMASMIICLALSIILPTIFAKAFANGSSCPEGKPLDLIIEDETAYFLFSTFVPLGDLVDAMGPYCCVLDDGSIVMKTPFSTQPYMYDTSLSLTKHIFPPNKGPAPQFTTFSMQTDSLGSEWKETAGIWRKNCDPYTKTSSDVDALCNQDTYCPALYPKKSRVPTTTVKSSRVPTTSAKDSYITTYPKHGGYFGWCNTGDTDWYVLPLCTANSCKEGYDFVAGVCWKACGAGQIDVGALCRDGCNPGEDEVAGVCWGRCGNNQWDVGALCRDKCGDDTPHEDIGICWSKCTDKQDDWGALCRDRCKDQYSDSGCCWGPTATYAREMKIPSAKRVNDPGYLPPTDMNKYLTDNKITNCDFSSETMLNRMGQFYYNHSIMNQTKLDDGRISYEYIFMFFGVIASSELSCDVACSIKTVIYDPITGGNYEESFGTSYEDEPGNTTSYRRFYFLKLSTDPVGVYTVTGCTHVDYTAPGAHVYSGDVGVDPPISVPKIFEVIDKRVQPGQSFDAVTFGAAIAATATQVIISQGAAMGGSGIGGVAGLTTDMAGDVIGGFAGEALSNSIKSAGGVSVSYGEPLENKVVGNATDGFFVSTNNDSYQINFGPIYEIRARDKSGYVPDINFCTNAIISELQCSHQFIVRDTINAYETQYPLKHVKTLYEVEPRGKDGCYFKWSTVSYDPNTNTEGAVTNVEEVVHTFSITDKSTCVFKPTFTFTDTKDYPVRTYKDPYTNEYKFPTKRISYNATYSGRYIRIRPSLTATDGYLQISQVAVYDSMGVNISAGKPAFCTTLYSGLDGMAAPAGTITSGILSVATGLVNTFQSSGARTEYVDIDLGKNYFIDIIEYYGRRDSTDTTRNKDIRFQVLYSNEVNATPVVELLTATTEIIQQIDFTTKTLEPKTPSTPFNVPRSIPINVNLSADCGARCSDKYVIDTLVAGYNSDPAYESNQIIKVLRAATPMAARCDYEVEMIRTQGGVKTVAKERISLKPTLDTITPNTGAVTARYIRLRPSSTATSANPYLYISQIVALDTTGRNVALGRKVFSTSTFLDITNNISCANPNLITDGTVTSRSMPHIWKSGYVRGTLTAEMLQAYKKEEYIDIDLGIGYPIQSVTYYGGSDDANKGVIIQLLASRESYARPIVENTLQTNDRKQTILFNKCAFKYDGVLSGVGSFIQDNTPFLESVDTSGGVLTFETIGKSIVNMINSIINPIASADPLGKLNSNVNAANQMAANTVNSIAAIQILNGCPNVKCNDPAVLNTMINMYNLSNITITDGIAETRKMTKIVRSGISSANTCDVLFTDLYEEYEDYVYPPTDTTSTLVAKRFTLTDMGNCVMRIAPGQNSIVDISANAVGITTPSSVLPNVFNANTCQVNCRDSSILNNVKNTLATQLQTSSLIPTFKRVLQSFPSAPNKCEYTMAKDVTKKSLSSGTFTTTTDLETYVEASFTMNPNTCEFTLNTVKEYDPDLITTQLNTVTKMYDSFLNGILVNLPSLFTYDNTTPSARVNETVQNL